MRLRLFLSLCLGCLLANAAAAQQPQVRVAITPDVVPVGEPVEVRVTVLVPTWFTSPPRFPSLDLANTITRQPPDSSHPTSERIGNDTWSGIVHLFEVYPLAAATYRLEDLTVTVTYADPNTRKPITVDVAMSDVELRAEVPDGAAALDPYISGTNLTLSLDVEGDTEALEAGDAVVLRYTAELDGLPAMFLPPLFQDPDIPGISVYIDEPVVSDGDVAKRSEKVTIVFDAGGEFRIPDLSLDWWDSRNKTVKTASIESVNFVVEGAPIPVATADEAPVDHTPAIRLAVFIVAVLVFLAMLGPRMARRARAASQRRRESEEFAFKRLQHALRSGDERNIHHEMIQWLDKSMPGSNLRDFAAEYGGDELREQVDLLSRSLYQDGAEPANARQLENSLSLARRRLRRQSAEGRGYALPPLNP